MSRRRPGFTVFELLLIIALLGFLFALLLPVILRLRLTAARSQSVNNLKQIGLSCHNYHEVNGVLPPGNDKNNFSAAARLLPYLEQDNLYKLINFDKPCDDKVNAPVSMTVIKTFLNPGDPRMTVAEGSGPTNYLFNAGSQAALKDNDGVFYQDSKVKFTEITDGTSNTLFAGETLKGDGGLAAKDVRRQYIKLDRDALKDLKEESGVADWQKDKNVAGDRCARWIDGRFLQGTFTGTRVMNDERPDVSCGGAGGLSGLRSEQPGVNVSMCDGSVRFVAKQLDLEGWKRLCARNDGQAVPDF
jgi:prepilin-type processing-associated H-X9-DG protein